VFTTTLIEVVLVSSSVELNEKALPVGRHRVVIPELRQSQDARADERLREVSRAI
jgi:hypothetical protein